MLLRVIIRNDEPLIFCQDSPSYRSIAIKLTPEQVAKIQLRHVDGKCYETVSKCFFEEEEGGSDA